MGNCDNEEKCHLKVIFKFRDNVIVLETLLKYFYWDNSENDVLAYSKAVELFFKNVKRKESKLSDVFLSSRLSLYLVEPFPKFTIYNLFIKNDFNVFNDLFLRFNNSNETNKSKYYFPNFHNYFVADFGIIYKNDTPTIDFANNFLSFLSDYMPHFTDKYDIEIAYIKRDCVETNIKTRNDFKYKNSDDYCKKLSLDIKNSLIERSVNLSIIEKYGWNFEEIKSINRFLLKDILFPKQKHFTEDKKKAILLSNQSVLDKLALAKLKSKGYYKHGNSTLSILSETLELDILNLQLCSAAYWELIDYFYEENAFLEAILHSGYGDVILFEFSSNVNSLPNDYKYDYLEEHKLSKIDGNIPIGAEPAIYELMCLAHALNITIIEPAANNNFAIDISHFLYNKNNLYFNYKGNGKFWVDNKLTKKDAKQHEINVQLKKEIQINFRNNGFKKLLKNSAKTFEVRPSILVGSVNPENMLRISETNFDSTKKFLKVFCVEGIDEYTHTSCSSAMIAGIVVALQSSAKTKGRILKPDEIFNLLSNPDNGDVLNKEGGTLPDFEKLINTI